MFPVVRASSNQEGAYWKNLPWACFCVLSFLFVSLGEFEQQDRTVPCHLSYDVQEPFSTPGAGTDNLDKRRKSATECSAQ
jgi:hypothetical protein